MKYVYFVSFTSNSNTGRAQVTRNKKIEGIEDIEEIEKKLKHENVLITNYILMRIKRK